MIRKVLIVFSVFVIAIVLSFSNTIFSDKGEGISSVVSTTMAQEDNQDEAWESDESGGKKSWYYFDCPYTRGKYCSTTSSSSSCGRSKEKPFGAC